MSVNFELPIFVKGTNRPAKVERIMNRTPLEVLRNKPSRRASITADWDGDGKVRTILYDDAQIKSKYRVVNEAPPTPDVDPNMVMADELYAQFHEKFTSSVLATKARSGELRDKEAWRMALFMLGRL